MRARLPTISKAQTKNNILIVKKWLKRNERNLAYIARHAGFKAANLTEFMKGHYVSPAIIARVSRYIGEPLDAYCVVCGQVHKTVLNGSCNKKGK